MKRFMCLAIMVVAVTLTGCASRVLVRVREPIVEASIGCCVWVRTIIGPGTCSPEPFEPVLELADDNGGYAIVYGSNVDLSPSHSGRFRLNLSGRVISATYTYDGCRPRSIRPPSWQFVVRNAGDNGPHALVVTVRYQNPRQPIIEYKAEYYVYNTSLRQY